MNSKIHRCGWCGNPTDSNGGELSEPIRQRVIKVLETYEDALDGHTEQHNGYCCPPEILFGDSWMDEHDAYEYSM